MKIDARATWSMSAVLLALVAMAAPVSLASDEWPQWRGPNRDGVASSFETPKKWPEKLTLKWKVPVGFGDASPVMSGKRVYLFTNRDGREVVTAVKLADGKQVWQDSYPVTYKPEEIEKDHAKGPKSTPVLHKGVLFTVGVSGVISAYDAETGKLRWRKEPQGGVKEAYPLFGMAISPLVAGDLLIAPVGGSRQSKLTALETRTGAVKWQWGTENLHPDLGLGFSSPILAEVGGTPQIIFWTGRELVSLSPESGKQLWLFPFKSEWDSVVTPVFHQGMVIVSGNPLGTVAIRINKRGDAWQTEQAWQQPEVFTYMNTPVAAKNLLFGLSVKKKGQYFCLDLSTGKTLWLTEGREAENAVFLSTDDNIFILNDDASLIVARNSAKGFESVGRYQVADSPTWAHPVVLNRQLLVKDATTLALWGFE